MWPGAAALRLRMSATRRERYDRLAANHRALPMATLRLLELGMQHCGHKDFRLADVVSADGEKPVWPSAAVDFSVSHAAGMVVVALTTGIKVGIDVEPANAVKPQVTQRLLSASAQQLAPLNEANATARWTQMEAIVKAAGLGVFHAVDIEWNREGRAQQAALNGSDWWYRPVDVGVHHVASVATNTPNLQVDVVYVSDL
jgi:phosphopantetheinyl transferase